MATNPNNAIGTNGAYGGRTSVNAFNDDLAVYSGRGIISGWACAPSSGLTVVLGGSGTTRDVAVAQDNAGNRTTINNISGAPVSVTLSGAPTANSRIDAIVAYVDNPPQGSATITDNYEACGIIAVAGTPTASPSAPTESAIRAAITADGASGATAYYVVLATITVATGTTTIIAGNITAGDSAKLSSDKIDSTTFGDNYSTSEVDTGATWTGGQKIYKKTIPFNSLPNNTSISVPHGIQNLAYVIKRELSWYDSTDGRWYNAPRIDDGTTFINVNGISQTEAWIKGVGTDWSSRTSGCNLTLYYLKSS